MTLKDIKEKIVFINQMNQKVSYYLIWFWNKTYWIINCKDYWKFIRRWTIEYLSWFLDWLYWL